MEQKFSDTYRTSFLTLDRYLQQSNSAQFYFRPLLPPLNTVSGEFFSLSPAQGTDPSIRINKYSSNGTFLGFGYLYDTSFNVPPADGSGGTVDVSGGYWTLTGSNIYNNNPGFVGVGTVAPAYPLDVSGYGAETVINATTDSKKAIRITQILATADAPAEIYFDKAANPAGAIGIDASSGRGMFLYYNGEDRVSIAPSGYVGIGTAPDLPTTMLDVSGSTRIRGPALSNLLFVGDASLNNPSAEQDTVKIGTAGVGGRLVLGDDGKGVLRLLNAFGDSYIETGTNMAVGSSGRLIFSSMFDLSGGPTMTVNTGTDEVVISNQFIDAPVPDYKLTVDGSANVLGNLRSEHHLPQSSYTYDLGSSSAYWRDLYLSTGTIYMGPTGTIGADGSGNILLNRANGRGVGINVDPSSFGVPAGYALAVSGDTVIGTNQNRLIINPDSAANATFIQSSAPNGIRFTPLGKGNTTLLIDTSNSVVGINTITPSTTLEVDGQATVALDISYANIAINPLTSQLILQGQTTSGRLLMGTYYTNAGGAASTIQSSRYYGSPLEDHGTDLLLNPLGGAVGINTATPGAALDVSGVVQIQNGGNKSLLIGNPISDAWYEDDVQIINAQGNQEASIILGCDGSGALRFVNSNSQTYIQSGLDISNNSGCKMNFTRFASMSQTMTIDTSYQYVYVGANTGNSYDGNQFVVDGSANILGTLVVNGNVTSSAPTTTRIYTDSDYVTSLSSTQTFTANIAGFPYSVYLVNVEASVDVIDGPATTANCAITLNNGITSLEKVYVVSCSVTGGASVSTGSSITSSTPVDKGTGTMTVNMVLTNCIFSNLSYIYLTIIGLC